MSKKITLQEGDKRINPKTGVEETLTPEGKVQPTKPTGEITTEQIAQAWKQRPDLQKEFVTVGAKGKTGDWNIYDWAKKYGQQEMPEIFGSPAEAQKEINLDDVNNNQTADQYINQKQITDFTKKAAEDAPEVRGEGQQADDPFAEVKSVLTGGLKEPETPSLVDTYKKEREERGITDLESEINDYDKKIADLKALIREEKNKISKEGISAGARWGRLTEYERDVQEQIDYYQREKDYAVNELNTKNSVLKTIMDYTKSDYETASKAYNDKFNQNIQLQRLLNDKEEQELTRAEKAQANARANLEIMANALSEGSVDFTALSASEQATINKLELQAGLPVGFISYIKSTNPKSDIISTANRTDEQGNQYIDVVMKDKATGQLSVKSNLLASGGVSTIKDDQSMGSLNSSQLDALIETMITREGFHAPEGDYQGSASYRNNNPGNIKYRYGNGQLTEFAQSLLSEGVPITEGSQAVDGGNFIKFPDLASGKDAMRALLTSQAYSNLTIDEAMKKWSGGGYGAEILPEEKLTADDLDQTAKNKIREATATFASADSMLKEIEGLARNVITAQTFFGRITQAANLSLEALTQENSDASVLLSSINAFSSLLTRAAGEKGMLTNQDVQRIINALPKITDKVEVLDKKLKTLRSVYESGKKGTLEAYTTPLDDLISGNSQTDNNADPLGIIQ